MEPPRLQLLAAPIVFGFLFFGSCSGGPKSSLNGFYESLAQFDRAETLSFICDDDRESMSRDLAFVESLASAGQLSGDGLKAFRLEDFSSSFLTLSDTEGTLEVKGRWVESPYGEITFSLEHTLRKNGAKWCVVADSPQKDEPETEIRIHAYLGDVVELLTRRLALALAEGNSQKVPEPSRAASPTGPPEVAAEPTRTRSGLQYIDLLIGTGERPTPGDYVAVHYNSWFSVDDEFFGESSLDRRDPLVFPVDQGVVIAGFDEGVASMKAGGVRRLIIPPELAYGETGSPGHQPNPIPPNATLIFDVVLLVVS